LREQPFEPEIVRDTQHQIDGGFGYQVCRAEAVVPVHAAVEGEGDDGEVDEGQLIGASVAVEGDALEGREVEEVPAGA
jgi:hypothetical protein